MFSLQFIEIYMNIKGIKKNYLYYSILYFYVINQYYYNQCFEPCNYNLNLIKKMRRSGSLNIFTNRLINILAPFSFRFGIRIKQV